MNDDLTIWPGPSPRDARLLRLRRCAAAAMAVAALLLFGCQSSPGGRPAQPVAAPPPPPVLAAPPPASPVVAAAPAPGAQESQVALGPGGAADGSQVAAMPQVDQRFDHRVALLLPLTGSAAGVGQGMLNAAQLALFDFADDRFEMLIYDTAGTPDGAHGAGRQAVIDGSALILGPLLASSVDSVAPTARAAGLNMLAFSNDRLVAREGVFVLGFLPGSQVERVVAFAARRGLSRFAALAPDDEYGVTVVEHLRDAAFAADSQVTHVEFYDPQAVDFTDPVKRIANYAPRRARLAQQKAELEARGDEVARRALQRIEGLVTAAGGLPYDALLIADGGKRLQAIAALLPYYDVDPASVRMLGTGQWDEPGQGAEPALVGGWFAAPPHEARADFTSRYSETYGASPPRLSTLAYDAVALAAVLAQSEGGPDFTVEALTDPGGFAGRDGIFRLRNDGLNERGLAVIEVGLRDITVVDPAPSAFNAP